MKLSDMFILFYLKAAVTKHVDTAFSEKKHIVGMPNVEVIEYILSSLADSELVFTTSLQIIFVDSKRLRSTLLSDIDESQLPDIYGGKLQLVPIQDC